jgi:hypothetical protein
MKTIFDVSEINNKENTYPPKFEVGKYVKYYLEADNGSYQPFIYKITEINEHRGKIETLVISNGINTYTVKKSDITLLDDETLKKLVEQEIKKLNYLFKDNGIIKKILKSTIV